MKLSSVHVKSLAINSTNISTEIIDGDEHIVIRGVVPIVDDVVMNGGKYSAEEINKGFKTIEGNPMPLQHPKIGNEYVSATNPRAVNQFHVGAWADNVRKDGDRVVMDMKVNKRFASSSEKGKRLLERLNDLVVNADASPIHVSTGLLLKREQNTGKSKGKSYSWVARNMQFDHVAILLDETGAATPSEGVGIFVNSNGEESEIENVNLSDAADFTQEGIINKAKFFFSVNSQLSFDDIYQLISNKLNPVGAKDYVWPESIYPSTFIYRDGDQRFKQQYLIDENQAVNFVGDRVEVVKTVEYDEIKTNGDKNPMTMKEKMIAALNAKGVKTEGLTDDQLFTAHNAQVAADAKAATETPEEKAAREKEEAGKKAKETATNSEAPAWFTPFVDKLNAIETSLTANSDKEKVAMREAVKTKFNMTDLAVNALDGEPLKELFTQTQTSYGLNNAYQSNGKQDDMADYIPGKE